MFKEWRTKLFESPSWKVGRTETETHPLSANQEFNLHPLGFPLSLAEGTRILGICYRTWKRWETLAMTVPEYKLQHILMQKRASCFNATPPIIPYQVWVIGKIGEIYSGLPNGIKKKWMAQEYVNAKKQELTRESYRQEQERFASYTLEEK